VLALSPRSLRAKKKVLGLDAQLVNPEGARQLLKTHILRLANVYKSARILVIFERNLSGAPFYVAGVISDIPAVHFFQESEMAVDFGFRKTDEAFNAAISTSCSALSSGLVSFSRDLICSGTAGPEATLAKFRSQATRYTIDIKHRDFPVKRPRGLYDLIESFLINISVAHSITRGAFEGFDRRFVLN